MKKKKKKFFLYSSCISKCCNLFYIVKLFEVCPVIFPFKEKRFPRKSLCSCVVVLPLCLLKFICNYIEFFPTNHPNKTCSTQGGVGDEFTRRDHQQPFKILWC